MTVKAIIPEADAVQVEKVHTGQWLIKNVFEGEYNPLEDVRPEDTQSPTPVSAPPREKDD